MAEKRSIPGVRRRGRLPEPPLRATRRAGHHQVDRLDPFAGWRCGGDDAGTSRAIGRLPSKAKASLDGGAEILSTRRQFAQQQGEVSGTMPHTSARCWNGSVSAWQKPQMCWLITLAGIIAQTADYQVLTSPASHGNYGALAPMLRRRPSAKLSTRPTNTASGPALPKTAEMAHQRLLALRPVVTCLPRCVRSGSSGLPAEQMAVWPAPEKVRVVKSSWRWA